ncbi:Holliday junction branch migration protein RuvA, partial [bacterium]|nr:Holliday junction branch migration protein RuvA [bacterium]
MYEYISGNLVRITEEVCIVDCNGIGYKIYYPSNSYLGQINDSIKLFIIEIHKDDGIDLYGFIDNECRELFLTLLKISKVGPKLAIRIISAFKVSEFVQLIINEDVKAINTINGVGKKTAERIILELKDKIDKLNLINLDTLSLTQHKSVKDDYEDIYNELYDALVNLGYSKADVKKK